MAEATLSSTAFPAGTTIGIYPALARKQGAPGGDAIATAVTEDDDLTISGLEYDTSYVAYALVNGVHRYVGFGTDGQPDAVEQRLDAAEASLVLTVSKEGDDIEVPEGSARTTGLTVSTHNPLSGTKERFTVENNQDTPEVDINIRNAVLNVGDPDAGVSIAGSQVNFMGPTGDTSVAWSILKNGEGPAGAKAMWASRSGQIQSYGYGVTSVFYDIRATADANARFRIIETDLALQWGPGGATAVDTEAKRGAAAGILQVGQVGANGGLELTFISTEAKLQAYDRGASAWRAIRVTGSSVTLAPENSEKIVANSTGLGFFGATPVAKPTGVAVTAAGVHAALVSLGLIAA